MPVDNMIAYARPLSEGMGQAVAERTVLRKIPIYETAMIQVHSNDWSDEEQLQLIEQWAAQRNLVVTGPIEVFGLHHHVLSGRVPTGERYETWAEVAHRVALGNAMLTPAKASHHSFGPEKNKIEHHISKATLLMSGRHLQHGDADQPHRNLEVFSNCSTAPMSFLLFMLLLNGSGVGRCYDDDMMLTNWDNAPNLRVVLDTSHADFDWSQDESVRDGRHKYAESENVVWHEVADTREGWAKALEIWETMAFQKIFRDHTLVLDFSKVRPRNAPIKGMQNRSSSGPKPLMNAMMKCASIKGAGMRPWMQAMYVDHYLAECVLVGGARRAARMATKHWKDRDILDFIRVKRPIEFQGMSMQEVLDHRASLSASGGMQPLSFLWSSNNSIAADAEFWKLVREARQAVSQGKSVPKVARKAWGVLNALGEAAYGDGTGEPGLINVDKLQQNETGWTGLETGDYVGSSRFQVDDDTKLILARVAKVAAAKPHRMITNPCGEIALLGLGGYCVIADVVPFHADTLEEANDAFLTATRALMRVNTMDNLYTKETKRTNRIGVGITGIHEFAWKFFKVGFRDLVKPDFEKYTHLVEHTVSSHEAYETAIKHESAGIRSAAFWNVLNWFSWNVRREAVSYAAELGVNVPHTVTTIKPAGTTSKLFGLTEGWHLPAMEQYLRWVQFRSDSPLVETYRNAGYQTRDLKSYSGTTIVGFPTMPTIGNLGMGDALVTASEATPADQYEWLRLGEKYWIGTDDEMGNQISYTLKYDPAKVSYQDFLDMIIDHQSDIRCCSVLPVTDTSAYEYLPEQAITKTEYEKLSQLIVKTEVSEDIGKEHVDCANGACPVDFQGEEKVVSLESVLT